MFDSTAARVALWRRAAGCGAVAVCCLAFTGAANAAIITVQPDQSGTTDNLAAAITTANTNADSSNTIVLSHGRYVPLHELPAITKNLTITGDHALQATGGTGGTLVTFETAESNFPGNSVTINAGVSVEMDGFQIQTLGSPGNDGVLDNGTLTMRNAALFSAQGTALDIAPFAHATMTSSTIDGTLGNNDSVKIGGAGATFTATNSDITNGTANGINNFGGTFTLYNTAVVYNTLGGSGKECLGGTSSGTAATDGSIDDDGSCGVQYSGDTSPDGVISASPGTNGGPTATTAFAPGSTIDNNGNPAYCPTTDQRFFVNPVSGGVTHCDIGAVTNSAVRDTTPATCVVTRTQYPPAVPVAQQDVTVTDTGSGLGPEAGSPSDPQAAGAIAPADVITNLTITNGTVAFTPHPEPSTAPMVLTATKGSDPSAGSTHWSFTVNDWAGNRTDCK